jgi:hypothetical protein
VQKVPVGKTLLIAAACSLIPLIGNVAASFVTEWTGAKSWLVVPAVGVVVAMVTALVQAYGSAGKPVSRSPAPYAGQQPTAGGYRRYGPQAQRGTPLALALLIAFLVLGVGGFGVAAGVRYAVGYITGNESGTDRLVKPATASANGLRLTVVSVTYTAHFTRVGLQADNETDNAVSLPLFGNCVLAGDDRTTLEADSFRSRWSTTLAPGIRQSGTITFKGHLPDSVTRASLSFAQIFGPGGGSITVREIRLRPA